ncbi:MAG TPA: DUF465 domain-containing protein [Citreicella sp.]|nr:DUF465 domain-containing protein [Citreicella sp.]
MTMESHVAELERRHAALEAELHTAMTQPATDDLTVASIKRRKLALKDEINRLRAGDGAVYAQA